MGRGHKPLLAELHAHTTWSDGVLTPGELVDLHGRAGFDVLAITDHVVRSEFACHVRAETYRDYLAAIDAEAERARRQYGMLVLPGLELTVESRDPGRAGHAVAVGLRELVSVDGGLEAALSEARASRSRADRRSPVLAGVRLQVDSRNRLVRREPGAGRRTGRPIRALQPRGALPLGRRARAPVRSRPATSTCPSTSSPGRRCSPASAPKARSSRDSARALPAP